MTADKIGTRFVFRIGFRIVESERVDDEEKQSFDAGRESEEENPKIRRHFGKSIFSLYILFKWIVYQPVGNQLQVYD